MIKFSTTKLTSKGQVVIPEDVRNRLGLKPGTQFVVFGNEDSIIFKAITPPSKDEFMNLLKDARRQARKAGMKKSDIAKAIKEVRAEKKS
ncbi:MAG: AbrB/MazE/SpoVT family DNA-binding domain-containing protein [Candidatus Omnitrophica bacterium]|nr:AbrB/MazE/SpoVT family DNA-binding domain-containing protein [Candidatus Omnitrophota bacterium]MCB9746848.1 AbrB/MazE/SpoVT family DNA-binding domain-containing protein [Candidatus Omnitrophota bacterium]